MSASPGFCPSCEQPGPAGTPCPAPVCAKRGYHRISDAFRPLDDEDDDEPAEPPDPLIGRFVDDYLVVEVLGHGGYGAVYRALDKTIGLHVALKRLNLEPIPVSMHETVLAKFRGEALALARLHHPNIVRVHRYGHAAGAPYLAMELVRGGQSLAQVREHHLEAQTWFSRAEVRDLLGQVLDGLRAAHDAGVIHRDIKPDNLMLQPVPGRPPLVRILDFGIAKLLDASGHTGISGTPEYMAPEQFVGSAMGPWTDLYAVGVLTARLIADHSPFPFDDPDELMRRKLDIHYDPLEGLAQQGCPGPVLAFLGKALGRRPRDRYQDTEAFRRALHDALAIVELQIRPSALGGGGASAPESDAALTDWMQRERARLAQERQALDRAVTDRGGRSREAGQETPLMGTAATAPRDPER